MKISIRNFQKKIPVNPKRIKKTILKVLSRETKKSGEISVCFVNDKEIRRLNRKFLRKDTATDVIAFDITGPGERGKIMADLAISCDTAARNAKIFKTTVAYELDLYAAHGILHLLGYDDHTKKDRELMRKKEALYVHP